MKPREMYSGAAPAAMGMMGQGLAEVGANIARTTQQGYQALGQGIGQVGQAIGEAYADYKQMDSDVKAKQAAAKTLLPYLPESAQKSFKDAEAKIASDTSLGLRDKKAFYDLHMNMLGNAVGHAMSLEKVAAEGKNRMDITKSDIEGRKDLEELKAFYDYFRSRGFGVGIGGGTGKGQGSATPTEYGTPSDEVPTFDHSVGENGLDSGEGIVNGPLPLAPRTKGMGLPSGAEAATPDLLIPANPVDTFAPTQKKSTLPLVGTRPFTPEEIAIYANMTDQQRGEWHRRNDPVTTQRWSPNNTYVPAIKQR